MAKQVLHSLYETRAKGTKKIALLIDPDTPSAQELERILTVANQAKVDFIFVGGSLLLKDDLSDCIKTVKSLSQAPVILFPGSVMQINDAADAILFLSLISGRNPDLLIGSQVIAAPYLKQLSLEILPTGYMLIDSGQATTASYMSSSQPIPANKPEIAACTAMAGEMLGLKLIYLDGGSGAKNPVTTEIIAAVRKAVDAPIIVGGGIKTAQKAIANCQAGADVIVVGNATEKNPELLLEIAAAIHQF
jgi:putative glycerol-1-phosphate prenyltransferase